MTNFKAEISHSLIFSTISQTRLFLLMKKNILCLLTLLYTLIKLETFLLNLVTLKSMFSYIKMH